jgi:hypothetical protein
MDSSDDEDFRLHYGLEDEEEQKIETLNKEEEEAEGQWAFLFLLTVYSPNKISSGFYRIFLRLHAALLIKI